MMKRLLVALAFGLWSCAASAAPESTLRGGFALCDPNAPSHCGAISGLGALATDHEGLKASYSVGFDYAGYAGTVTDMFCLSGSASKVIRVRHVMITGHATGGVQVDIGLIRRSTLDSGGTPTNIVPTPYDSTDPTATAVVTAFGAAPTLGTLVGSELYDSQLNFPAPTGGQPPIGISWPFGARGTKAVVLRGVNEAMCGNFLGVALPAGAGLSVTLEWTEE